MTEWTMDLLTVLGAWISGIGSLAAAGVALWLGCRKGIKLEVTTEFTDRLYISITNLSDRPVIITRIDWRVGRGKQWKESPARRSYQGMRKLEYGERESFNIFIEGEQHWLKDFKTHLDIPTWRSIKGLRLCIRTTTGYKNQVTPVRGFLKKLEAKFREDP